MCLCVCCVFVCLCVCVLCVCVLCVVCVCVVSVVCVVCVCVCVFVVCVCVCRVCVCRKCVCVSYVIEDIGIMMTRCAATKNHQCRQSVRQTTTGKQSVLNLRSKSMCARSHSVTDFMHSAKFRSFVENIHALAVGPQTGNLCRHFN